MTTSTMASGLAPKELPLIDSKRHPTGLQSLRGKILGDLVLAVLGAIKPGEKHPLPDPVTLAPYHNSKRYGVSHYNVVIPDLPAPHYFMACSTMLGASSFRVYDIDFAAKPGAGPRYTANLSHGTAAAVEGCFKSYSMLDEMSFEEDGSLVRFGNELEIGGMYPNYFMRSNWGDLRVDIEMTATGEVSWFTKSTMYNHISLLTRYRGSVTHEGKVTPVSGLCSLEYARGITPFLLVNRQVPRSLKFPFDVFSYHVITLDDDTQLMFAHVRVCDYPSLSRAYLNTAGKGGTCMDAEVHFKVLSTQETKGVAPDGGETTLPKEFTWDVRDNQGNSLFEINGTVDTPMLFGLGMGFIGGYRWEGTRDGKPMKGRGYIEYVDQRN